MSSRERNSLRPGNIRENAVGAKHLQRVHYKIRFLLRGRHTTQGLALAWIHIQDTSILHQLGLRENLPDRSYGWAYHQN
jgi:hypothetical protein